MSKHTPGPWTPKRVGETCAAGSRVFVAVYEVWSGSDSIAEHIHEADANLIASAPDLLEALKALLDTVNSFAKRAGWPDNTVRDAARAAIAKAEGV